MVCNASEEPDPAMVGCYYSVLNVLDPSIHYDSTGKVTGRLMLPPSDEAAPPFAPETAAPTTFETAAPTTFEAAAPSSIRAEIVERNPGVTEKENEIDNTRTKGDDSQRDAVTVEKKVDPMEKPPEHGNYKLWVEDYLARNDILEQLSSGGEDNEGEDNECEYNESEDNVEASSMDQIQADSVIIESTFSNQTEAEAQPVSAPTKQTEAQPMSWFSAWTQAKPETAKMEKSEPAAIYKAIPKDTAQVNESETVQEDTEATEHAAKVESSTQSKSTSWLPWAGSAISTPTEEVTEMQPAPETESTPDPDPLALFTSLPDPEPDCRKETKSAPEPEAEEHIANYGDATPLLKTIALKNWHGVLFFLRTGSFSFNPLNGAADAAVIKEQVQTWAVKKDLVGNEMWRLLPLHAAICFGAPENVIKHLVEVYPGALKKPDGHGNLVLHHAFIFGADENITALLMRSFPAALHVMNNEGLTPVQCSSEVSCVEFQSKGELFDALSDYTRAVAEDAPEKLVEQLQDVKRQLKAVNETLFSSEPPRKVEEIKYHIDTLARNVANASRFDPASMLLEGASMGFCSLAPSSTKYALTDGSEHSTSKAISSEEHMHQDKDAANVISKEDPLEVGTTTQQLPLMPCRVKEYCRDTKTWREV